MGKFVGFIIGAIQIGVGIVTGNVALIASGIATIASATALALAKTPKPETVAVAVKMPLPPRVSAYGRLRLYGAYILYETSNSGRAVDVWAFHDGRIGAIEQYYIGDDKVTRNGSGWVAPGEDGRYGKAYDRVRVKANLGNPTEAAWSDVVSELPGIWTSQHRGDGVVTGYMMSTPVKSKDFQGVYSSGGPNQTPVSIVVQAQCVFDWRDGTQSIDNPASWKWTENAVLHTAHYLLERDFKSWTAHFLPTLAYWTAAANDADSGSPLKEGGTEPRYRSCVAHKHTDDHKGVLANLLGCFDGWMAPRSDGALIVYSGRFYEPTVTIGPSQIVSYSVEEGVQEEAAINDISLTYVSSLHDYNTVDCDAWRDEDDISNRGKVLTTQLANQVPSYSQARRLAKRTYAAAMAPRRGSCMTNASGRTMIGQRYINLRIIEAGVTFNDGPVEIIKVKRNPSTGAVTFDWIAADPNIDAWNPATEQGEGAAVGDRVAREPLETPVIDNAVAEFAASTDGGTGVRVNITATGLDRQDVTWYARWRVVGAPSWVEDTFSDLDPGASVLIQTGFVQVGELIEVEVSYQTGDGRLSDWSEPFEVDSSTDAEAPDAAATITVISWADTLSLATDRIPRASSYRWRFYGADGTTLVRQIVTSTPAVAYTAGQAATDGARRSYVAKVAGVNGGGAGGEASTGVISLPAPAAVTGVAATGGTTNAEVAFTLLTDPAVAGYLVPYSTASGFDPLTQGTVTRNLGSSPQYLQGLAAGTFYTKVAAFDAWTDNPGLLNFSTEDDFTITTGGGGSGGGGGGGGGGYCVTTDTLILMADCTERPAGDLVVGDMLRTQHETTLEWGDYPISAIEFVEDDVLVADIGVRQMRATADHRIWLTGWVRMEALGVPTGRAIVAKITVADAHTYVSNGVLSHNVKAAIP
ncbi:Hint domain-containing protein [Sphingomonas sp. PB4P5]|uniref:Hint domain-containing protein n=1 Tax=Parasphingomonas puruogangriensis TaxID=3096155 RepID=UPI002FCBCEC2